MVLHPDDDAPDWIQDNIDDLYTKFLERMDLKEAFEEFCQTKFEEHLQYYNDEEDF